MIVTQSSFLDDFLDNISTFLKPGLYLNSIHYQWMIEQMEFFPTRFYTKLSKRQLDELIRNAYLLCWPDDEQQSWLQKNNINFIEHPCSDEPIITKVQNALLKLGYDEENIESLFFVLNSFNCPPLLNGTQKIHPGDFTHW